MNESQSTVPQTDRTPGPLLERVLRGLIVGVLAIFLFYLKVLGTVLKWGIRAFRKAPAKQNTI